MDTLRLIKINNNQLYVELSSVSDNFSKKIEINLKIDSIKNLSRKITHDIRYMDKKYKLGKTKNICNKKR